MPEEEGQQQEQEPAQLTDEELCEQEGGEFIDGKCVLPDESGSGEQTAQEGLSDEELQ
jgi:hypothetical protein